MTTEEKLVNRKLSLMELPLPHSIKEAKMLIEQWRREYNQVRPLALRIIVHRRLRLFLTAALT